MTSLVKNIIVIAGLLALAALGYYLFVIERDATINNGSASQFGQAQRETEEFLRRLEDLQNIKLSRSMFSESRFQSLTDFSSIINRVPVGRTTPFSGATESPTSVKSQ